MKYFIGFVLGILFTFVLGYVLTIPQEVIYDCKVAEWHPDVPAEVKEECRKLRSQSRIII